MESHPEILCMAMVAMVVIRVYVPILMRLGQSCSCSDSVAGCLKYRFSGEATTLLSHACTSQAGGDVRARIDVGFCLEVSTISRASETEFEFSNGSSRKSCLWSGSFQTLMPCKKVSCHVYALPNCKLCPRSAGLANEWKAVCKTIISPELGIIWGV